MTENDPQIDMYYLQSLLHNLMSNFCRAPAFSCGAYSCPVRVLQADTCLLRAVLCPTWMDPDHVVPSLIYMKNIWAPKLSELCSPHFLHVQWACVIIMISGHSYDTGPELLVAFRLLHSSSWKNGTDAFFLFFYVIIGLVVYHESEVIILLVKRMPIHVRRSHLIERSTLISETIVQKNMSFFFSSSKEILQTSYSGRKVHDGW